MKGDRIRAPFDLGWRIFTIKVVRFKHLNNDPHFDCEEYNEDSSYGGCLKKELRKIYESALNCTPPLLVEEPSRNVPVCNKRFNMTEDKGNQIRDMFENNFNFKPALCKKPCTQTTYEVQSMQVIKYPTSSIGLNFDSSVDLTETEFRTTFVMLLTGLGGSVRARAGKSKRVIQWKRQTCEKMVERAKLVVLLAFLQKILYRVPSLCTILNNLLKQMQQVLYGNIQDCGLR